MNGKTEYCNGFMFSRDRDRVALICKDHPEWQAGLWNGIGGKCREGEPPDHAMAREFQEEAGVLTGHFMWEQFCSFLFPHGVVHFHRIFTDSIDQVVTAEREQVTIHQVDELPFNIVPNLRWLIPLAQDRSLATPTVMVDKRHPKAHHVGVLLHE